MCGVSEKTVSVSAYRLYQAGLIVSVVTETVKRKIKYKTSVYILKPLPKSGFFFVPRRIFRHTRVTAKMFAVYCFMCRALSAEYGKSWNSYNDICAKLGFGKNQRSEVVKLIGELVEIGLIKKTVRRIKKVFADNIYRVVGYAEAVTEKPKQKEKRPDSNGTQSLYTNGKPLSTVIISPLRENVKPFYRQLNIFCLKSCEPRQSRCSRFGVGCDFTDNIY